MHERALAGLPGPAYRSNVAAPRRRLSELSPGGACAQQGVADPAVVGEQEDDAFSGLPGSVDVSPGFVLLDGLLVMPERLPSVPGPHVDVAELVLEEGSLFVVVRGVRSRDCW